MKCVDYIILDNYEYSTSYELLTKNAPNLQYHVKPLSRYHQK